MARNLLLSTIIFVTCTLSGLAQTKNIVINEDTYKKLTAPGVNHVRMAKKADKRKGIIRVKDAPHERLLFEKLILQDPSTGKIPENVRERELNFLSNNRNQFISRTKAQNIDWKQTGPYNVGGRTKALAVDITDNNIILAGGVTGGMWRSEDGGASWTKTTISTEHQSVTAVAQDPRDGFTHIWYYATGEYSGSATARGAFYSGAGVYKSDDGGKNWKPFADTDRFKTPMFNEFFDICWNITVDPTNGDLYVATYGGIYKYNSGEETRNFVLDSKPTSNDDTKRYSATTDIICTPSGIKFATLSGEGEINGIFMSATGNANDWTKITPEGFPTDFDRTVLAYAPSNENILYFLSETPGQGLNDHSLWKLTINGEELVWEDRSLNLPPVISEEDNDVSGYTSQNSYDMVIKVAPDDENMVFIGGTNLHRSDDGFATKMTDNPETNKIFWIGGYATANNVSQYDNHHPDQHALVFLNDGKTLLSGHDGGISKTNDYKQTEDSDPNDNGSDENPDLKPVDWLSLNNGYLTTQAYTVGIDAKDGTSFEILTGFQDNGTWYTAKEDNGIHKKDWIQLGSGDGAFCSMHNNKDAYITSSQRGRIYLNVYNTIDKEWEWTRVDPDGVDSKKVLFINPYEIDGNNEAIMFYAGATDIWRNTNIYQIPKFENNAASEGWEKVEDTNVTGQISAIKSSIIPANLLYFGTSDGKIYKTINSHSSQAETIEITAPSMPDGYVSSIEVNPANAEYVYATFSNYEVESIFFSENAGETWTAASGSLEIIEDDKNIGPSVRYINVVNAENGPVFFAGTSIGLYMTTDLNSNTEWTQVSTDKIGNTVVNMVKTREDGFIVVGSHGNGIFHTNITPGEPTVDPAGPLVGIEDIDEETTKFSIYPNPLVVDSRVEFPNKNSSPYRLIVIDASGRVVRIIENITNNNITINREQLKPGIHIINLEGEKIYKGKLLVK